MTKKEITDTSDNNQVEQTRVNSRKLSLFKSREEKTTGDYVRNYLLETLAIFLWSYILIKVFILDIDRWFISNVFPGYEWILDFKLIYFLILVCILWIWIKTRDAVVWFLYVSLYPLILLFIKLPYYTYKQKSWLLAFSIFNAIAAFFSNLRYGLFYSTIFLTAFVLASFSNATYILIIATIALLILVFIAFVRSFLGALKPTIIFRMYSNFFKEMRKRAHTAFAIDDDIRSVPVEHLEQKQLAKWNESLQTSVLFNRLCLFAGKKLRDYQKSAWQVIPSVFGLLYLIAFTVVSFSGIYYALYKIDHRLFRISEEPSWFTFFYFSFNNLILNTTTEVAPAVMLSQCIYIIQASLSFVLMIILATLFISHRAQRASSELDQVIEGIEAEARDMEAFIQEEYKFANIDAAIERLKAAQSGLIQVIYWLSGRIKA